MVKDHEVVRQSGIACRQSCGCSLLVELRMIVHNLGLWSLLFGTKLVWCVNHQTTIDLQKIEGMWKLNSIDNVVVAKNFWEIVGGDKIMSLVNVAALIKLLVRHDAFDPQMHLAKIWCMHEVHSIDFKGNTVGTEHLVLSQRVVDYACGNPLAIKVLGSVLYSRSKEEWESALDKLEAVPNKDIQSVLKINYGELDDKEQDIFLDIACFFKGYDVDFVQRILGGCGLFASTGMQSLIDKSLITIIDNELRMHGLLQEMGREIVREESIKQPGDRSRLWKTENIHHVFKRNTGSAKVEGIFLNTSEMKVNSEP
nr:disease resistance protein RUN1-like [Ziziphus jujuba var. spinosa]